MRVIANSIEEYIEQVPEERKEYFNKLRDVLKSNIPEGFHEELNYGMIGYVVPHSLYSPGYHTDPKMPLPFANIANQKGFIALYHMGIYSDPEILKWFQEEYAKRCKYKLDMGKSCIRFKKLDDIPYDLIAELMQKVSVEDWVDTYEKQWKK
jgi:uncharacterized protein YdhG (YjbR/CyaY superfamily)